MGIFIMSGSRSNISFRVISCRGFQGLGLSGFSQLVVLSLLALLSACQTERLPAKVINVSDPAAAESSVNSGRALAVKSSSQAIPAPVTTRLEEVTGTLKTIDRRGNRIVVQMDNGKLLRLKVSGLVKKQLNVQPGQRIGFSLRESVEIIRNRYLHAVDGGIVAREAPGSSGERENYNSYYNRAPNAHHGSHWEEDMNIPATVVQTYPDRSEIRLVTKAGRQFTVKVSDGQTRVDNVTPDEPVIVRFREVDEIHLIDQ